MVLQCCLLVFFIGNKELIFVDTTQLFLLSASTKKMKKCHHNHHQSTGNELFNLSSFLDNKFLIMEMQTCQAEVRWDGYITVVTV